VLLLQAVATNAAIAKSEAKRFISVLRVQCHR
jgi:hypothetical protein